MWRHIPGQGEDWSDPRDASDACDHLSSVKALREYLDRDGTGEEIRISDRVLEKWGRLFDIVLPSGKRTCCFTRGKLVHRHVRAELTKTCAGYTKLAERTGSVLQLNEDLDASSSLSNRYAAANLTDE